ncbi:hypothetical protein SAMN02983003_3173 [Devosia enhydra]|uniref:DUF3168 domain-containing protein n=1 Tax=Devosia enhydra TaxID=665118 RepID=A0A1K2I0Z7_9HYPH|nr:hypothetical protein [Devosia enhydra]SFZ86001.1 hypothetical protein SAMN02983003_3173 [Devosia enhydra]
MFEQLKALVETVDGLEGRVSDALVLAELVRQGALPQGPQHAFIVPLGLVPTSSGDAGAGVFTQMLDEQVAVLLVVRSAGDVTGAKARPRLDGLVEAVLAAVNGADPGPDYPGVFRLVRGQIVSAEAGLAIYQLDFALQRQFRRS